MLRAPLDVNVAESRFTASAVSVTAPLAPACPMAAEPVIAVPVRVSAPLPSPTLPLDDAVEMTLAARINVAPLAVNETPPSDRALISPFTVNIPSATIVIEPLTVSVAVSVTPSVSSIVMFPVLATVPVDADRVVTDVSRSMTFAASCVPLVAVTDSTSAVSTLPSVLSESITSSPATSVTSPAAPAFTTTTLMSDVTPTAVSEMSLASESVPELLTLVAVSMPSAVTSIAPLAVLTDVNVN